MSRLRVVFLGVLCVAALYQFSTAISAQTPPEIESAAIRTADRIVKAHGEHIFVGSLRECQLDKEACTSFEEALRGNLEKSIPGIHLIKRESITNILEGRGFIAVDAYFPDVLKAVATQAGVDILVTASLKWQSDGYELTSEVYDPVRGKKLDQFRVKIMRPVSDSGGENSTITDPESRVSVIVPNGDATASAMVEHPNCVTCPNPSYTPEARAHGTQGRVALMVTITEQGAADHIGVVDGLGDGLTGQAVEAVRSWRFKPAIGKDGKPFAARVPIEVTFR